MNRARRDRVSFQRAALVAGWLVAFLTCGFAGAQETPTLTIGSKQFTEGIILGDVLRIAAESAGADAVHKASLGGTPVVWEALKSGQIDAYVEYRGTLLLEILAKEKPLTREDAAKSLEAKGLRMGEPLGFNDQYALGMRRKHAESLGIRTISDFARVFGKNAGAPLRMAFSEEFNSRADGWQGLATKYGIAADNVRTMDHTLAYNALANQQIDVTDIYTTDAEIEAYDLLALEDDRGYFPSYEAIVLWRIDLEQKAPKVVEAFRKLEGQLSQPQMTKMNARVRNYRETEVSVAADYVDETLGYRSKIPPEPKWKAAAKRIGATLLDHMRMVSISLLAAIVAGVPLGVLAYWKPKIGAAIVAVVGIVQTIPAMALFVFLMPLLGLGFKAAVFALFLYSILPILRGTFTGLNGIAPSLLESAQSLGLSPWASLRLIELPLAMPSILSGVKTAAVINVGMATIGAIIGAGGLGDPIVRGVRMGDLRAILEGAIPAALLAIAVQFAFDLLERWLVPAGLRARGG